MVERNQCKQCKWAPLLGLKHILVRLLDTSHFFPGLQFISGTAQSKLHKRSSKFSWKVNGNAPGESDRQSSLGTFLLTLLFSWKVNGNAPGNAPGHIRGP
jgi:hypothetical protein